jgi:hypothetical protein
MKIVLLLALLISCTDDTGYSVFPRAEQEARDPLPFLTFSTRLSNELSISGKRCLGNEVTDFEGVTYGCESEQWLIIVDHINNCTPEGCTSVAVKPTIAELLPVTGDSVNSFFEIAPVIPVSNEAETLLESVFLRVDNTSQPTVVFRQ